MIELDTALDAWGLIAPYALGEVDVYENVHQVDELVRTHAQLVMRQGDRAEVTLKHGTEGHKVRVIQDAQHGRHLRGDIDVAGGSLFPRGNRWALDR